jgi:uncharacterized protein YprB with RNaseH-like and TPR domain
VTDKNSLELRRRLQRIGRRKPTLARSHSDKSSLYKGLLDGELLKTSLGMAFRIESHFQEDHLHGQYPLSRILTCPPRLVADVARNPTLEDVPINHLLFLDTETTGLAGGAGTLVFLVGVGAFVGEEFRIRQYFLRDPSEEMGMLHALQEDIEKASGFVTYNGQAFDLPILENRYIIALREHVPLISSPNLDLLHLTRRLWRHSLPDCTLTTVESQVLGVQRSEEDVPGAWIPGMYLDYLRTGDASDMKRVIYHNVVDILSLVSLTSQVVERYEQSDMDRLSSSEALAVARWHQDLGRGNTAETAFKRAISTSQLNVKIDALRRYSAHLKREGRRVEAVESWITWHELSADDHRPCIELAKYYEWEVKDNEQAQYWAQQGLLCLTHWPADWRRDSVWEEIENRLRRLAGKAEGHQDDGEESS